MNWHGNKTSLISRCFTHWTRGIFIVVSVHQKTSQFPLILATASCIKTTIVSAILVPTWSIDSLTNKFQTKVAHLEISQHWWGLSGFLSKLWSCKINWVIFSKTMKLHTLISFQKARCHFLVDPKQKEQKPRNIKKTCDLSEWNETFSAACDHQGVWTKKYMVTT